MSSTRLRPPLLLLLVMLPQPCLGERALHVRRTMQACSDPYAVGTIEARSSPPPADPARTALVGRDRRCFVVTPDQSWEAITQRDGLLLARRKPASPGEPPLFFRPDDMVPDGPVSWAAGVPTDTRGDDGTVDDRKARHRLLLVLLAALLALPFRLLRGLLRRFRRGRGAKGAAGRRRAIALASAEIEAQRNRLRVRRLQLVIPDRYGSRDTVGWSREKAYFSRSRILRSLAAHGLAAQWPVIAREIDRRIERAASPSASIWRRGPARHDTLRRNTGRSSSRFDPRMDPVDYERHCALLLRRAGWNAEVTTAGGDQGTDVLARRGKRSLVLQCKLYSRPVGNSAVQQIAAARAHHRADLAAVVSNADFTRQARELAATNGVYLLHHEELHDFPPSG